MYDKRQVDLDDKPQKIPENGAVIIGSHGGRGSFARIRVHPNNFAKVLPPAEKVSDDELKVLAIMAGIKSQYRPEYFRKAKLGKFTADNPVVSGLIEKKMLKVNRRGSFMITTAGKNARGDARIDNLL